MSINAALCYCKTQNCNCLPVAAFLDFSHKVVTGNTVLRLCACIWRLVLGAKLAEKNRKEKASYCLNFLYGD